MRDLLELAVVDVEHVSVRHVPGNGHQAELTVTTKRGALRLRLIRVVDLRARGKRRRRGPIVAVPFAARDDGP
jgi:hypothetical protein